MKPILVTCYAHPDLDGVSGSVAYAEFLQKTGKTAVAGIFGELHEEAKYILNRFSIGYPQVFPDADEFDAVILVDSSDLKGLDGKVSPEKVIEIIDHRKINDAHAFPNAKVQIELVGAAATLVAEKFIRNDIAISKESAILLCGGIVSNTLNFKAGVTTDRDREAFEWLNNEAKLPEDFWKELFLAKSDLSGDNLAERIKGDFAWFEMGDKRIGIAQIEMIGAKELVTEREIEILQILNTIKEEKGLDYILQSTLELEGEKNFFVTGDLEMQGLLEKVLGIEFVSHVAMREGLIMRKQIVPLLKTELES
jgi:manganese-dependent inorganic pyrophosphatase